MLDRFQNSLRDFIPAAAGGIWPVDLVARESENGYCVTMGRGREGEGDIKRGMLLIGGAGPGSHAVSLIARGMDLIVAADSGLEAALAAGLSPDLVVGDMDSLSDVSLLDQFPSSRVLAFPREKDETDTEIGLRVMKERGCREITLTGGGNGRIDHLLGVVGLFERPFPPCRWLTDYEDMRLVEREAELIGWQGSTVSVFPVGKRAARMHSEGLQWPLDGLEFRRGFGGISNRATADRVLITVAVGKVLVIRCMLDDAGYRVALNDAGYLSAPYDAGTRAAPKD
jgi:thiamine pyrophosphokinase